MRYFSPAPRRPSRPSVPRLGEHERRRERQALINSWLNPNAGVAQAAERRSLPAADTGANPVPRSPLPLPRPYARFKPEPLVIAIVGLVGAIAIVLLGLAGYAASIVLRGLP